MMIFVLRVRILIHWNIPSYYVLQMLSFIIKSYHGLICPIILLGLRLLFIEKYVYSLKINKIPITCTQFIDNLKIQRKIESLTWSNYFL